MCSVLSRLRHFNRTTSSTSSTSLDAADRLVCSQPSHAFYLLFYKSLPPPPPPPFRRLRRLRRRPFQFSCLLGWYQPVSTDPHWKPSLVIIGRMMERTVFPDQAPDVVGPHRIPHPPRRNLMPSSRYWAEIEATNQAMSGLAAWGNRPDELGIRVDIAESHSRLFLVNSLIKGHASCVSLYFASPTPKWSSYHRVLSLR